MKLDFLPFNQKFLIPVASVLVLVLAGGGYYFYSQYQTNQAQSANPQAQAQEEAKRTQGRSHMIWGVIALAVMLGVWGLVGIVTRTFGPEINVLPGVRPN